MKNIGYTHVHCQVIFFLIGLLTITVLPVDLYLGLLRSRKKSQSVGFPLVDLLQVSLCYNCVPLQEISLFTIYIQNRESSLSQYIERIVNTCSYKINLNIERLVAGFHVGQLISLRVVSKMLQYLYSWGYQFPWILRLIQTTKLK